MTIQLPGYQPLIDNAVYQRMAGDDVGISVSTSDGKPINLLHILMPRVYTAPTENRVIAYLQNLARSSGPRLILPPSAKQEISPENLLETLLSNLPDKILADLRSGDEDCLRFVRNNTPVPNLEDAQAPRYLLLSTGLLPENIVQTAQQEWIAHGAEWFDQALMSTSLRENGLGLRYNIKLLLTEGTLPDHKLIDKFIQYQVDSSRVLDVSKANYDSKEVNQIMSCLYLGFSLDQNIDDLRDTSDQALREAALMPVHAFHKMLGRMVEQQQKSVQDRKEVEDLLKKQRVH